MIIAVIITGKSGEIDKEALRLLLRVARAQLEKTEPRAKGSEDQGREAARLMNEPKKQRGRADGNENGSVS